KALARLPGLGARSARRIALHLLRAPEKHLEPLQATLARAAETIGVCSQCGNLDSRNPCAICADPRRADGTICVVADVNDLWALERTGAHRGQYHVLGGVLSALQGIGPEDLRIAELLARMDGTREIIMALPPTVDGQTTAHVVEERLHDAAPHVAITRLAVGIPVGGALEYLDEGTLRLAVNQRR
ncbi:MAG TPA: recombination protein RecR, partial [Rhodospirillaceae bacterium]|nr:recombination protein RecR [Rhodospirillaceae bacterium]